MDDATRVKLAEQYMDTYGEGVKEFLNAKVDALCEAGDKAGLECLQVQLIRVTMQIEKITGRMATVGEFDASAYLRMQ